MKLQQTRICKRLLGLCAHWIMWVCLGCLSLLAHSRDYSIFLDTSLDSSHFSSLSNKSSSEHALPYWWRNAGVIDTTGLSNEELYQSAQAIKDNSMSLNHKLMNYQWLNDWSQWSDSEDYTADHKKRLRQVFHRVLDQTWDHYNSNTESQWTPQHIAIKYRLRVNHDKARFSISIDF